MKSIFAGFRSWFVLPIVLNPTVLRIGVAGQGDGLRRRLRLLAESGVEPAVVFTQWIPQASELAGLHVLFVAGLDDAAARALAAAARSQGVLINVEDQPAHCDFHVPAAVRRGDLLFTVSTAGRSPGLSRLLREELERHFGPEWESRVDELARLRADWHGEGLGPSDVSERTRALFNAKGWLS